MNDKQLRNPVRLHFGMQSVMEEVCQRSPHKPKELSPQMKRRLYEEAASVLLKTLSSLIPQSRVTLMSPYRIMTPMRQQRLKKRRELDV